MDPLPHVACPDKHPFSIRLPKENHKCDQTEEWFVLETAESTRKLRIQDYPKVYRVPGLYEAVVYDTLKCHSHERFADILRCALTERGELAHDVSILELGAGNGVVGEKMKGLGIGKLIGLDLLPEARDAALRDRPNVYDKYVVADLTKENPLEDHIFDGLVVVSALGLGGVPSAAFLQAAKLLRPGGMIGLTFKSEFLNPDNKHEFGILLRDLLYRGLIELEVLQRYRHRYTIAGDSIFYTALIAKKVKDFTRPQRVSRRDLSRRDENFAVIRGIG